MNRQDVQLFTDKKIKIFLKRNNIHYTGKINILREDSILFKDKFGNDILISLDNIEEIHPIIDNSKQTTIGDSNE